MSEKTSTARMLRFQLRHLEDKERALEGRVAVARGNLGRFERELAGVSRDVTITKRALVEMGEGRE
jgi:hypothetical protein